MLAVQRVTKQAERKALNATFVMEGRLSGANADSPPITIPIEDGFAKLQIANVAIAAERGCKKIRHVNHLREAY